MIRRAHWGLLSLLLAPLGAWALGLGDIELRSALNQPLEADIQLVSATPEELAALTVNLASPETFQRYGLDRPAYLGRLRFNVARDAGGRNVIRVTSVEPITEPFVTVLVEANWARGRLLREYTVLLDPPVLLPREAVPEPVQPASTRAPQPAQPSAVIQRPPAQTAATPTPAPTPAPAQVNAPRAAPAANRPNAYGPVERGETLWAIASRYRPAGITMNQMMVAIYRANPSAFQGNMNLLRQGATLDMPSDASLSTLSATEATQVAIGETAAWEGRGEQQARLRLLPPEVEAAPTQPAAATRPAPAPAPATSPAATTGRANTQAPAQDGRVLSIEDEALSNLQQLANEPPATEVQPAPAGAAPDVDATVAAGVDLELDEIFAEEPDATAPVVDEQPAPAPAPAPRPAATTQVVATPAAPSLVSRIIGWLTAPLLWVAVLLVALVGAGAVYLRSRQSESEELTGRWEALEEDSDEDTETREVTERLRSQARAHPDTTVVEEQHTQELPRAEVADEEFFDIGEQEPEPVEEDMLPAMDLDVDDDVETKPAVTSDTAKARAAKAKETADATLSSQTVINLDQADPIAEADFHMAYGLYDQAADLIQKALEASPDDRALLLKLLEVYFVWGNREAFLDTANILRAEIGSQPDSDWDKVVIMGKQICPEEALFAGAVAAATGDSIDLDLAAGDSPALDLAFDDQSDGTVDLDLGGADDDATLQIDSDDTNEQTGVFGRSGTFDIGDQTAAGLEAAFFEKEGQDASAKTSPNLDLDSQTQEAPTMETIGPDAPTIESPVFDQDIDASAELPTLQQPKLRPEDLEGGDRTAEIDLDDLGLDLNDLSEIGETPTGTHNSLLDIEEEESDVLSATGVTQVLSAGDTFDDADKGDEDTGQFTGTEVLAPLGDEIDATARYPKTSQSAVDNLGLDIDLDELSAALDGEDTVEQPNVGGYGGNRDVEFDVGFDLPDGDEPTAREPITGNDAQTMTEVGTKLDLARAYIDMGDPEGARSILEEVLDEGDTGQKKEAQGLIDAL